MSSEHFRTINEQILQNLRFAHPHLDTWFKTAFPRFFAFQHFFTFSLVSLLKLFIEMTQTLKYSILYKNIRNCVGNPKKNMKKFYEQYLAPQRGPEQLLVENRKKYIVISGYGLL